MADSNSEFPTTIGADAAFKGELRFEKGVQLRGKFEGEITSGGQLVVAEGAALNGDVKAGNIRVDGQVKGNLSADTKIQLTASARLEGDLQAARLEVAEGAVMVGRCSIGTNSDAKAAGQVKTAPADAVAPPKPKTPQPVGVPAKK
jgi:cytoskeletal protein CcmA (bactofilin family)